MDDSVDAIAVALTGLLRSMPDPTGTAHSRALERDLAACFGVNHAVAVASGTAAIHAALVGLDIGIGDEVLVPALSVVMSVAPVVYVGATPVFVDCDEDGTDFDFADLEAKFSPRTRAVLPVHLWGRTGDLARLTRWAGRHSIAVIEDACQAQGSTVNGRHVGTFGDVGCFSMKDGKVLWSGEGGYLLTNDESLAASVRSFRSHGQLVRPNGRPAQAGHNYRLAEPLAVIARSNLERFDELLARRRQQANMMRSLMARVPGVETLNAEPDDGWNGYSFLATLTLPEPRAFCEHLAQVGVPNSIGTFRLVPADQQPAFAQYTGARSCEKAAAVIERTLAVILNDRDDDHRLTSYAQIITQEAQRWQP